eukprot:gene32012-16533_t
MSRWKTVAEDSKPGCMRRSASQNFRKDRSRKGRGAVSLAWRAGESTGAGDRPRVDQASTRVKPSLANPACKPQRQQVKIHANSENVDQNKAGKKTKRHSLTKAAPIPEEERAAELQAIHEELETELGMAPEVASKIVESGSTAAMSVLASHSAGRWYDTLFCGPPLDMLYHPL